MSAHNPEHLHHEIHRTMHSAEHPLFKVIAALTVLMAVFAVIYALPLHNFIISNEEALPYAELFEVDEELYERFMKAELYEQVLTAEETAGTTGTTAAVWAARCVIALFILCIVLYVFATLYVGAARVQARAVRVTQRNFPHLYDKAQEYAAALGMKTVPDIYIMHQNGLLNALSGWVIRRNYIVLSAELCDIALMENHDWDTVDFALAREFGHIHLYHTRLWYKLLIMSGHVLFPLGACLERSEVYSCDRIAQLLTDDRCSAECLAVSAVGRHLYHYVDAADYVADSRRGYSALERLSLFIANFLAKSPIMPYRMAAILDPDRRSGRLF